jgi:hypothetical protein
VRVYCRDFPRRLIPDSSSDSFFFLEPARMADDDNSSRACTISQQIGVLTSATDVFEMIKLISGNRRIVLDWIMSSFAAMRLEGMPQRVVCLGCYHGATESSIAQKIAMATGCPLTVVGIDNDPSIDQTGARQKIHIVAKSAKEFVRHPAFAEWIGNCILIGLWLPGADYEADFLLDAIEILRPRVIVQLDSQVGSSGTPESLTWAKSPHIGAGMIADIDRTYLKDGYVEVSRYTFKCGTYGRPDPIYRGLSNGDIYEMRVVARPDLLQTEPVPRQLVDRPDIFQLPCDPVVAREFSLFLSLASSSSPLE